MRKTMLIGTLASSLLFSTIMIMPATTASAKTTYLPKSVRSHKWYRLTDGYQAGYHDKTIFKGNKMTVSTLGGKAHWHFTGLKRHSKKIYYGRLHYSKKNSEPVKVKIISSKHFDIIPKHFSWLKGNYTGNEKMGAIIYKR